MPNRVVREGILDSDRMDKISWAAECFYRRLHSVVDDYGCFDARISILKSKLYPTEKKQAMVSLPDIAKWLTESVNAGLIRCYEVSGKKYLIVLDFNQTIRLKRRKYPPPPDDIENMSSACIADASHMLAETNPNQSESESESGEETNPHSQGKFLNEKIDFSIEHPKDFLLRLNEINYSLLEKNSGLLAENFKLAMEKWSFKAISAGWAYSGNNSKDYQQLFAQASGYLLTWSENEKTGKYKNGNSSNKTGKEKIAGVDADSLRKLVEGRSLSESD